MAKKSTTSKRKTKTPKKASAKSASARSKTVKSKVTKVSAASSKKAKAISLSSLNRLHIFSIFIYALLIASVFMFMKPTDVNVTMPYLTQDPLNVGGQLVEASRRFYSIDLRWMITAVLGISLVLPILYLTRLKRYYQSSLDKGTNSVKWYECAIVGVLILETIAILSGWTDIVTIKLLGLSFVLLVVFGCMRERQIAETKTDNNKYAVVMNLTKLFLILLLGFSAVSTVIYGLEFNAWYVYVLYAGLIATFIAIGVSQSRSVNTNFSITERNRQILDVIVRAGFTVVLIAGLMK